MVDRLFLVVFFSVWTVLDLPFYFAKRAGLPVREIGERRKPPAVQWRRGRI